MEETPKTEPEARYHWAIFAFTALLCTLLIFAAKSAPAPRAAMHETVPQTLAAANVYALPHTDQPLLSSQMLTLQGQVKSMHEDVAKMQFEFIHLQETLDLMVGEIMTDLKGENENLREEINRMYARLGQSATEPGQVNFTAPAPEVAPSTNEDKATQAMFKDGEFGFIVLEEWGRTPEDALRLGNNVSTLKGIIGLVPPNSLSDDLQQLGIDLRMQYTDYDNINIEVFDNKEAAESFSKRQAANPANRVLSISKHASSGRDVVLLVQNGQSSEIPF